ncbi:helix-turn-helix domain-containing protein [Streptomyces sp. NPDC018059]|uniref:helix-turn-helix domain-containing protein n=1 Tax=Streptomyces sp. NPDC018059 TaxID=3365041 RepID=UPI0037AF0E95
MLELLDRLAELSMKAVELSMKAVARLTGQPHGRIPGTYGRIPKTYRVQPPRLDHLAALAAVDPASADNPAAEDEDSPAVRGRRLFLGAKLRGLRHTTGLTTAEAARRVGWHQSKLSRIETGRSGVTVSDVRLLLEAYCVTVVDPSLLTSFLELPGVDESDRAWSPYPSRGLYWPSAAVETTPEPARAAVDVAPPDPVSPEELRVLARQSASTINHTLARLFVQLGPPPEGAGRDPSTVTSDGGGAQQ